MSEEGKGEEGRSAIDHAGKEAQFAVTLQDVVIALVATLEYHFASTL